MSEVENIYMKVFANAFFDELGRHTATAINQGEIGRANNLCGLASHMALVLVEKLENQNMTHAKRGRVSSNQGQPAPKARANHAVALWRR
jgi:hypothetical protein